MMHGRHRGCYELAPILYPSGTWMLHIPQPGLSKTLIITPCGLRTLCPFLATRHGRR
jgi:hypothetical protein